MLKKILTGLRELGPLMEVPEGSVLSEAQVKVLHQKATLLARCEFPLRGRYSLEGITVATAYPFGFFVKTRPLPIEPRLEFYVGPARVRVDDLALQITARTGAAHAARVGAGDEYFAMRDFRSGDDLRRVKWRRSARTRRWVVVENEAPAGRDVTLSLHVERRPGDAQVEYVISCAASLAERLLERGFAVGLAAPGIYLAPAVGGRRAGEVALELARLDLHAPFNDVPQARASAVVALCSPGVLPAPAAELVLYPSLLPHPSSVA